MKINFSEDAVVAVSEKAMSKGTSPLNECNSLFKDFQFGLKLIQKNTGKDDFLISAEAFLSHKIGKKPFLVIKLFFSVSLVVPKTL